jgi:chromosome partitioning protein
MSGKVITVAQQKGGAGKTTLVAQLAVALTAKGRRIALVDIDPQGSLTHWFRVREESGATEGITLSAITGWRTQGAVEKLKDSCDVVLIDSAPHAETEAKIAVRAANLVLVPIQPSPMDLWATESTLALAQVEKRPALLVLNRVQSRVKLAEALAARIAELGVEVAKATIGSRTPFAASMLDGKGVIETAPGSKAAAEITALAAELTRRLGRGT